MSDAMRRGSGVAWASTYPVPWHAWAAAEARLRVPDAVNKTVVFIGRADRGPFVPYGTGFIVLTAEEENVGWQNIVTAKHVIERIQSDVVYIRINRLDGGAELIKAPKSCWAFHPDPAIDVAVCPSVLQRDTHDILHVLLGPMNTKESPNIALSPEVISAHNIGIGDEVFISGMFVGRIGEQKNIPVLRMGTIAAMPGEKIRTEYGFHDAFLLEVRSIDGLSGSPVFLHLPLERQVPRQLLGGYYPGLVTSFLLGMVLGYNQVYGRQDVIDIASKSVRPTSRSRRVNVPLNTGLAVVMPVARILEAINQPALVSRREIALRDKVNNGFVPCPADWGAPSKNTRKRPPK